MPKVRGIFCLNSQCKNYFEDNCMKIFKTNTVEISAEGRCNDFEAGTHKGYGKETVIHADNVIAGNMPLRQAAAILQSEFSRKADWYDALVASINSILHEESSEYLIRDLAVKIADRLIGE